MSELALYDQFQGGDREGGTRGRTYALQYLNVHCGPNIRSVYKT